MIALTFLKEMMLIKQEHQKSVSNFSFRFQPNVCSKCHNLLKMSVNLSDIAILNIRGPDYRCIVSLISKNKTINLLRNADLTKKSGRL